MKPPRLTVRRLMVAVAISAVAIGIGDMARRSFAYRSLAGLYGGHQANMRREVERLEKRIAESPDWIAMLRQIGDLEDETEVPRRIAGWRERLAFCRREVHRAGLWKDKYDQAARHPWLPAPRDPPESEDTP